MEYFKKIDHTINGCCSGCGDCCANVLPISKEEVGRIKQYIKKNNIVPVNRNNVLSEEYIDICPFLSKDNRCNIYELRPEVCKSFMCCNILDSKKELVNHKTKEVTNLLKTFFPNSYCPKIPDFEKVKNIYNGYKERLYGKQ